MPAGFDLSGMRRSSPSLGWLVLGLSLVTVKKGLSFVGPPIKGAGVLHSQSHRQCVGRAATVCPTLEADAARLVGEQSNVQRHLGEGTIPKRVRIVFRHGLAPEDIASLTSWLIEMGAAAATHDVSNVHLRGASDAVDVWLPSEMVDWREMIAQCMAAAGLSQSTPYHISELGLELGDELWGSHAALGVNEDFEPVVAGGFQVISVQKYYDCPPTLQQIRLFKGEGWGTGHHPSTALCLDFLAADGVLCGGERVIDYGCGSAVLSIAAVKRGARECVGIDVCYDALANAQLNVRLNGVAGAVELTHGRTVVPQEFQPADVVVANILVGTLLSLALTIVSVTQPGGWLCLCGIRPEQTDVIRRRFQPYVEWTDELEATGHHDRWGSWVRLVGRRKIAGGTTTPSTVRMIEALSDTAVS